jgi:hypothetical protein
MTERQLKEAVRRAERECKLASVEKPKSFVGPLPASETQVGRIVQYLVLTVASSLISILTIRVLFPEFFMRESDSQAGRKNS